MGEFRIETERLVLREWRGNDALAHNALCHLPELIDALGTAPSTEDSHDVVRRQTRLQSELGYCFWVVELRARAGLQGWCGIKPGKPPIQGHIEIGWSLHPDLWGLGLAQEAARATLRWTWMNTDLASIVGITSCGNVRSRVLMERLGMIRRRDLDFDHPDLPDGSPLKRHVSYSIARPA